MTVAETDVSHMSCPRVYAETLLLVIVPHQSPIMVLHQYLPCLHDPQHSDLPHTSVLLHEHQPVPGQQTECWFDQTERKDGP